MDIPRNAPQVAATSGTTDYFVWQPAGASVSILLSRHVVGSLEREVMKGFHALRKRGAEVGGLLLGRIKHNGRLTVLIERLEAVPSEYRFGPSYRLSEEDRGRLEQAIARAKAAPSQQLTIVGFYRSNTRPEMRLDQADLDLIHSLFASPDDVILLVRPISVSQCSAAFFFWNECGLSPEPSEEPFPFGLAEMPFSAYPEELGEFPAEQHIEDREQLAPVSTPPQPPAPEPTITTATGAPRRENVQLTTRSGGVVRKRSWALVGVLSVVIAALGILVNRASKQIRLDNSPKLTRSQAGAPNHRAGPQMEPQLSTPKEATAAPAPETKAPPPPRVQREERRRMARVRIPAKVIHQVLPTISSGIRARLQADTRVDVRIKIDASGRVTSATPMARGNTLYRYLAARSAAAARQWRFEPAMEDGTAAPSTEILHFTFRP